MKVVHIPSRLLVNVLIGLCLFCSAACGDEDETDAGSNSEEAADSDEQQDEEPTEDEGDSEAGEIDPESAAGIELVALYAGTYDVTAEVGSHKRGTVTISADGLTFDFDDNLSFTLSGENVYNRIPNFPDEPRVQIEIPGDPQQRLRIFVDPSDTSIATRFHYDDDASDGSDVVEVVVQ